MQNIIEFTLFNFNDKREYMYMVTHSGLLPQRMQYKGHPNREDIV